jgi:hypothetical protein
MDAMSRDFLVYDRFLSMRLHKGKHQRTFDQGDTRGVRLCRRRTPMCGQLYEYLSRRLNALPAIQTFLRRSRCRWLWFWPGGANGVFSGTALLRRRA